MAKCRYCGRSGWFLSLSAYGLCRHCYPAVTREIQQRIENINDSKRKLEATVRLDEKISECHIIIQEAEALIKYEKMGFQLPAPPTTLLRDYKSKMTEYEAEATSKEDSILRSLELKVENVKAQAA